MQKQHLVYNEYLKSENMESPREMVIIKAISGDGSDNIPAVTSGLERKYSLGATRARNDSVSPINNCRRLCDCHIASVHYNINISLASEMEAWIFLPSLILFSRVSIIEDMLSRCLLELTKDRHLYTEPSLA